MDARRKVSGLALFLCLAGAVIGGRDAGAADKGRLSVAVTEPDVEAIVRVVGGDKVDTFSLFRGCILRKDLMVESAVRGRLLKADVLVWTAGQFDSRLHIPASLPATIAREGKLLLRAA